MKLQSRQWVMIIGLLMTLALVFNIEDEEEADLLPAPRKAPSSASTNTKEIKPVAAQQHYLDWSLLQGRAVAQEDHPVRAGLFRPQYWYVPPPKTAAELAPPPPVAPQPGFAYIGKLEDGPQGTVILLASASRLYSVSIGEQVDRAWRLDKEDEQNLHLTYLPLNLPKILPKKSRPVANVNPASHLPGDPDDLQGNL